MMISFVVNVLFGLQWEVNQLAFDVSEVMDGCVCFCGIFLILGLYEVEVIILVQVLVVIQIFVVIIFIFILFGQVILEGFIIDNILGCGEVVVNFINNVFFNGIDGFSYIWDFGNG